MASTGFRYSYSGPGYIEPETEDQVVPGVASQVQGVPPPAPTLPPTPPAPGSAGHFVSKATGEVVPDEQARPGEVEYAETVDLVAPKDETPSTPVAAKPGTVTIEDVQAELVKQAGEQGGDNPWAVPDYQKQLTDARKRQGNYDLMAAIAKTGADINAALSGRKSDGGAFEFLRGLGQRELDRFNEDVKLDQFTRKQRQEAEVNDPSSRTNQRWRSLVASKFPELAKMPGFENLTQAGLEKLIGLDQSERKMKLDADKFAHEQEMDSGRMKLDREKAMEVIRHNRAMEGIEREKARRQAATLAFQQYIENRNLRQNVIKLGDKLEKYAGAAQTWSTIEKLAPGLTSGIVPEDFQLDDWHRFKSNILPGQMNRRWSPQDTNALETAVRMVKNDMRKDSFGSALSDHEKAAFDELFDDSLTGGPASMAAALQIFRQHLGSKVNSTVEAYRVDPGMSAVTDEYLERTGWNKTLPMLRRGVMGRPDLPGSAEERPNRAPAPANKGGVKPQVVTGKDGRQYVHDGTGWKLYAGN